MNDLQTGILQQLIKDVKEHRDMTEQEMDAIANVLEKFGKRLIALEATVDRMEKKAAATAVITTHELENK